MPEITVNAKKAENLIDFIPDELDKRFPAIVTRALIRYRGFHRARRLKGPASARAKSSARMTAGRRRLD